jgi:hypothetical protein
MEEVVRCRIPWREPSMRCRAKNMFNRSYYFCGLYLFESCFPTLTVRFIFLVQYHAPQQRVAATTCCCYVPMQWWTASPPAGLIISHVCFGAVSLRKLRRFLLLQSDSGLADSDPTRAKEMTAINSVSNMFSCLSVMLYRLLLSPTCNIGPPTLMFRVQTALGSWLCGRSLGCCAVLLRLRPWNRPVLLQKFVSNV